MERGKLCHDVNRKVQASEKARPKVERRGVVSDTLIVVKKLL